VDNFLELKAAFLTTTSSLDTPLNPLKLIADGRAYLSDPLLPNGNETISLMELLALRYQYPKRTEQIPHHVSKTE
jgi:hypothetical protein